MLLTLLKILFFFAVVLAVALGAQHLGDTGQVLRIVFDGVEYTLGPIQAATIALVLIFGAWLSVQVLRLVLAVIRFLAGDKTAIDRYFDRARERKGYQALAEGMLAVASGEGRLAQDKANRAAKFLDQPHLTNVLAAQAAETAGDPDRAEKVYREMLGDQRTRFVAVRGLMKQRLVKGDTHTALKLAEKAYALKPSHGEVQDTLLSLQTREGDWKGARATLKDKRRQGALPQDVHLRRDAVLALQEAKDVLAEGASISAREAAISANRASPDLVPAAVLAAQSYLEQKDGKNAARVLEKAWAAQPHPSLAAAYAEIAPDETPQARLKRFEKLIAQAPTHEESRLLQAELMLAAEDFPGARRALGNLADKQPTVRSLSIMAAVERGEGAGDGVVRAWLARALTASRGKQWVCDNCHNVMADWSPVCDSCGAFDTLSWREPPADKRMAASSEAASMLPLLVGQAPAPETEADAPAQPLPAPASVVPSEAPGRAEPPRAEPPRPAPPPPPPPRVAPGMVPRESDYDDYAPSSTVTHAEPVAPPAPKPVTAAEIVSPKAPAPPPPALDPAAPPVRPDAVPFDPEKDDKIV